MTPAHVTLVFVLAAWPLSALETSFGLDVQTGVFFRSMDDSVFYNGEEEVVFALTSLGVPFLSLDGVFRAGDFRAFAGVLSGINILSGTIKIDDMAMKAKYTHNTVSRERLALNIGAGYEFKLLNGALVLVPRADFIYQLIRADALDGSVEAGHNKFNFSGTHWHFTETNLMPVVTFSALWHFHPQFSAGINGFVYPYIWAQTAVVDNYPTNTIYYFTWNEGGSWGGGGGVEFAFYPASFTYLSFFCALEFEGIMLKQGIVETGVQGYSPADTVRDTAFSVEHSAFQSKVVLGLRLLPSRTPHKLNKE
ncbi:MAG: hypothetical protein LBD22_06905 [Spirochaetaceae bacterium]|jgi:hypothetical protein|nr:hypothetical protein [Spirochaetaceae bacterium]